MADEQKPIGRREFVSRTAQAAAVAAIAPGPLLRGFGQRSPNDVVNFGVIGCGVQGYNDGTAALRCANTAIVAAASCYDGHLEHAKEEWGEKLITTRDYRQILDNKGINAVVIATPDHWHTKIALDALAAGKDVYCEKPLTHTVEEGDLLVKAVKSSGRIFQVGSQHTSTPAMIEARDVIASGMLGTVTQVKASWDTNCEISSWNEPVPPDASERTVDWVRFQGSAPKHPWNPSRVFGWRRYRDYGEGLSGDVLVHIITLLHYVLNLKVPTIGTAVGGHLKWKEGRTVYDTIMGNWEYPEGIITTLGATQNNHYDATGIRIMGDKATMVLTFSNYTVYEDDDESNWRYTTNPWPRRYREEFLKSKGIPLERDQTAPRARGERKLNVLKKYEPPPTEPGASRMAPQHMQHFLDCVRNRRQPVQDVVMGNNAAITAHMANLSYFNRQVIKYDRQTGKVIQAT